MRIQGPAGVSAVLTAELDQVEARRAKLFPNVKTLDERVPTASPHGHERAHRVRPLGFAVSGGGIRSATFNLGILQGLAEAGLLPYLDFLSTVSGGGYIGSWLHAIILRKFGGDPRTAAHSLSPKESPIPGEAGQDPVSFLRKYSNYLAPRVGLFQVDFWVIGSIWVRNMFLNLLILVPFLGAVQLFPVVAGFIQQRAWAQQAATLQWVQEALAACLLLVAVWIAGRNLRAAAMREFGGKASNGRSRMGPYCSFCIVAASFLLACAQLLPPLDPVIWLSIVCAVLFVLYALLQWTCGFMDCYFYRLPNASTGQKALLVFHFVWIPLVCAATTTVLFYGVWKIIDSWEGEQASWHLIAWATPLIVQVWLVGAALHVGLMGNDMVDASREWIARVGAELGIACLAWAGIFVISVFGPYWISLLLIASTGTAFTAMAGWIGTTVAGILSGNSARTTGETESSSGMRLVLEWVGRIAPGVFMAGLLLLISAGAHQIVALVAHRWASPVARHVVPQPMSAPPWLSGVAGYLQEYFVVLDDSIYTHAGQFSAAWWPAAALFIGSLVVCFVIASRVNINEFSLHHFYKNRLVRCYLGASMGDKRQPNPLTGFDSKDDFPISNLRAIPRSETHRAYLGPYAIINTTLNLNQGSELATQERKGASFIFSPLFCGFDPRHSIEDVKEYNKSGSTLNRDGYRQTEDFAYPPDGPNLGTALAISGAAANPNSGYSTSGPVAFLLTMFNVRLGWWVGNPRMDGVYSRPGPTIALRSLLAELFALTDARSPFLNLSDGGHLENLGLYELVRRRCRYIIIGDGEQDGELNFGSLGGAIRKCRADFGVEIEIDPLRIQRVDGWSRTHCVVGTITYPEEDACPAHGLIGNSVSEGSPKAKGWILYLKASLTGDEPEDVTEYHASHTDFPHQSTANQFFTESQFESYRQLGLHVVRSVFENIRVELHGSSSQEMTELFQDLARKWYPPSAIPGATLTSHANAYSALLTKMSDPELSFMDTRLFDALKDSTKAPLPDEGSPMRRKAFFYCLDLIQLMENVFTDLNFRNRADRLNPNNSGWLNVFRYWAQQDIFLETWRIAGHTFNDLFREFFDALSGGEEL